MAYYRDSAPLQLTNWRLYRDQANGMRPADVATEFAGRDAPKMKFLFTVSFEFGPTLRGADLKDSTDDMATNIYPCKNVTRPNINVNYVDVNAYNYRHKVATKTEYGTVTVTMYDDNNNTAHNLLTRYLAQISPVSKKSAQDYNLRGENIQRWASLGPLPVTEADGLIRAMKVVHHVNTRYDDDPDSIRWVKYEYINPKIQAFVFDELDMTVSDVNTITITFVYDSVRITNNFDNNVTTVEVGEPTNA